MQRVISTELQQVSNSARAKILIADDIDANLLMLERMLKMNGYEVVEAKNGEQAIEVFEREAPDLILMDINMPEVNGHEATSRIKQMTVDNYVPIIFVTAMTEESSLAESLAAGGDDFISKPISCDVLHSKINAHLRIRELNKELNAKNRELAIHNLYLQREQELVDHYFENALAQSDLDENVIKYHMSSMSVFNGDVLLAKYGPDGSYYLILGDFTGHGLTAAMGTLPVAQIFFKLVQQEVSIEQLARELNQQLKTFLPSLMFFAANLLKLNVKEGKLTVWSGAMPPAWWLSKSGELKGSIESVNLPLGVLRDSEFNVEVQEFAIDKGDRLYLYSDGVTESRNPEGEMFGVDRLKDELVSSAGASFDSTIDALQKFRDDQQQNDDLTFVEITCGAVA